MPNEDTPDPYSVPSNLQTVRIATDPNRFEVQGTKLVIFDGATLPPRCIKTNETVIPGTNGRIKRINLNWIHTGWILLIFLPLGLFVFLIVCLFKTQKGSVTVHLSEQTVRRKKRWLFTFIAAAICLPLVTAILNSPSENYIPFAFVGSVLCLIFALFSTRYVTPVKFQDGQFFLRGINKEFLRDIESGQY